LQLELEDETVVGVTPIIGYIYRGIEKAGELNPFKNNIFICERICGICSFTHALCYCETVEKLMKVEVPPRARFLRLCWSELSRIHSHLLWLGLFADGMGFESLFMQCWRAREMILDISEMTSGHRIIQSTSIIGGVRRDIDKDMAKEVEKRLNDFKDMMDHTISPAVYHDYTIKRRAVGKGLLSTEQAKLLGAVGPTLRASNVPLDIRQTGYAAYKETGFEPIVEPDGDSYARTIVRVREIYQSRELILKALSLMPEGELSVKSDRQPS
jgi:NADH:ubiquinone oxidoreductase 49 kD subunit 7